jgi:hypothetical protein
MKLRRIQTVICSLGLMLLGTGANLQAAQYDHEIEDNKISFAWKVDGDNLAVKVSARTTGWVGIGFNPSAKMKDANFILGYVKGGKAEIVDEVGDSDNSHTLDTRLGGTEDVTLVGGTEEGGTTTIEFVIPLKSSDKNDSAITVDGDTTVMLAYGAGRDSFKSRHQYRTALKVNLSTGASEKAK